MCRQPTVHPRILRRLPDRSGQFGRGEPHDPRPVDSLLHVYRSPARTGGIERRRGATSRYRSAHRKTADECRASDTHDRRETRLYEGACRRARRPHSWLHDDWRRSWRGRGRGTDGDAGGPAIYAPARCHSRPSDHGGRTGISFLECAAAAFVTAAPAVRHSVEVLIDWSSEKSSAPDGSTAWRKRMEAE